MSAPQTTLRARFAGSGWVAAIGQDGTAARTASASRDLAVDTMRGLAIVMVIGIHSLRIADGPGAIVLDAALRPSVAIFLFLTGLMTARSLRVPVARRLARALVPYAIAFAAAYLYMAVQNPAMDHRPLVAIARFGLGYVFVYYSVFVYVGCTLLMWLVLAFARGSRARLLVLCGASLGLGLLAGAYLEPLLQRLGASEAVIDEARLRDVPFWFGFMALGMMIGALRVDAVLGAHRGLMWGLAAITLIAFMAIRLSGLGDAAYYDSTAYFAYAAAACLALTATGPASVPAAYLGSGSWFIYLAHIFPLRVIEDYGFLRSLAPLEASLLRFAVALSFAVAALIALRKALPGRATPWFGA